MKSSDQQNYEQILRDGGFLDRSARKKIDVTGPDRVSFLHSMISHDVQALSEGMGRYATFLTATGKIIADFYLYKLADHVLIDVDAELATPLQEALERFVIMDDVTFSPWEGPLSQFAVYGPSGSKVLQDLIGGSLPETKLQIKELQQPYCGWVICRPGLLPNGFEVLFPGVVPETISAELRSSALLEIPPQVAEMLRIEAMIPSFGVDMTSENNPLEARLESAYSLTKGCYVGQEVVAKATHVGGVNRLLVGLEFEADAPVPPAGSLVIEGEKKLGFVTSACFSPRFGAPIALAYLRRKWAQDEKQVHIDVQGRTLSARVRLDFAPRSPA